MIGSPARSYDAVVIGAGVIGASIALHLARAGLRRVVVLERAGLCSGNTRKSGALVRTHYTNLPEARLALASLRYFQDWASAVGGTCGFRRTGFAILVAGPNVERLRRNVARLQGIGVNTRVVGGADLRELQPHLLAEEELAAAYEPESGYADPVATTTSLMAAAQALGVELREGTPATAIKTTADGARAAGVDTAAGFVPSPVVVCAANVWSPPLLRTAGVEVPIRPHRAQVAFFQRPGALGAGHLTLVDTVLGVYTRPHGADLTLGGLSDWPAGAAPDPDGYDEGNDRGFAEALIGRLGQRLPPLAQAAYAGGHAGLYDLSPDTRPVLDQVPSVEGLYVAVGFSGTGFKIAPAVGLGLAELVTTGEATSVDLAPFRFTRFAEGQPLIGADEYELPTRWGHRF